ncbi:MBL fold metallo-hydrolase [Yinghuangia seranimata]|uniref:MBL fold metallo-hydrolase n=1 Tax=Yinghuangia seranimata TaxID=408067 RepID=UPI00248B7C34|nr:MBL fold metallo-hydrolase [Yinghuangia seranimata]MDI2124625.1 MBL fold metallo-hydrolase [Yinghuangia seranimata]
MTTDVPRCTPYRVAAETWLVPRLVPAGEAGFVPVNSMVVTGEQPVLVDTGALIHADAWREDVFGIVEPEDVRWIFLSHEDMDHMGNLATALEMCPNATLVTDFGAWQRMSVHTPVPPHRMRWLNPGERLDLGDRTLQAILPPQFDAPTTRGFVDTATGVMWAADAFGAPTPGEIHEQGDLPPGLWDEVFMPFNSMSNPWHGWLDADRYGRHLDELAALPVKVAASCHGPVLREDGLADAYLKAHAMAGAPVVPAPGQPVLDEILAAAGLHEPVRV